MKRGRGRPPASKESTTATPVRQSRRLVSAPNIAKSASTPQTSKYFEHSSSSSQSGDIGDDRETESVYEADDISVPSVSESDVSSKDISDEDVGPRKRRQIQKTTKTAEKPDYRQAATGTELWRAGVKSELAPGKEDATIHPNTLLFLADLKMNK
ncbi:MAG: hypothetical protein MMC23_004077 [Stictis urceolatum]|nr:hypothetical protein [Stictis urceolata]